MTANPKWQVILDALLSNQTPSDRPELVARVFEMKRKCLMEEVKDKGVFGLVVAHVLTIEFQKRGLPHMHALFFLNEQDKIRTAQQVDNVVCAELPYPDESPMIFDIIKSCMIHGPCGTGSTLSCMENGVCTKRYPRAFVETTTIDPDGYPLYHRRDNDRVFNVRGHDVFNRNVVPYNAHLSEMFGCHINVEVCAGLRCVKYIHKYIYKGHDRTTIVIGRGDEIQQYLDARYIGPPEAAWRIFGFALHEEYPSVVRLSLHLEGQHRVVYDPTESIESIRLRAEEEKSKLVAFLDCCKVDVVARAFTYLEFPQHDTWQKSGIWTPRGGGTAIGRLYFASPNGGERFYLRLLLLNVKGPQSWNDLRTVDGILFDTFKAACVARGLLEDNAEWVQCLQEAAFMKTGYQLRRLFGVILTECFPVNPEQLWNRFALNICDDLAYKIQTTFGIPSPTNSEVTDYGLHLLDQVLHESGKCLADFPPMPSPIKDWNVIIGNRLIWEHRQLQYAAQRPDTLLNVDRLNDDQRNCYNAVTKSVDENKGTVFFLNGGAGTGKTFLYNTIAAKCRSLGHIVISVASSGITSLLLVGG